MFLFLRGDSFDSRIYVGKILCLILHLLRAISGSVSQQVVCGICHRGPIERFGGGGGRGETPAEDPDNNCTHFLFPCPWHVFFMQKFAGPDKTVAVCFETVGPVDGAVALALRCPPLFAHPCTMKLFAGHSCCLATVTPRWKSARKTGPRRQAKMLRNDVGCVCVCVRGYFFPSPYCDPPPPHTPTHTPV